MSAVTDDVEMLVTTAVRAVVAEDVQAALRAIGNIAAAPPVEIVVDLLRRLSRAAQDLAAIPPEALACDPRVATELVAGLSQGDVQAALVAVEHDFSTLVATLVCLVAAHDVVMRDASDPSDKEGAR